jgi:uncharacterized protein
VTRGARLTWWAIAAVAVVALASCGGDSDAQEIPEFESRIVDAAGAVPDGEQRRIEDELAGFEQRTGMQLAVAVVETTGDQSIEDYSIDLAREWGVGSEERDDGVVLVVAVEDRRVRIEVGRGAEGDLTDAESGRIIRERLVPRLRDGDIALALLDGTRAIRAALGDTGGPGPGAVPSSGGGDGGEEGGGSGLGFLAVLLPVLFFSFAGGMGRRRRRRRGGGLWALPILWGGGFGGGYGHHGGGFGGGGGGGFGGGGASGSW